MHVLKPPVSTSIEKPRTPSTDVRGFFARRGFPSAPFSSLPCALLAELRREFRQRLLSKAGVIADAYRRILIGRDCCRQVKDDLKAQIAAIERYEAAASDTDFTE